MKAKEIKVRNITTKIREFTSLDEFYKYICDTPINEVFRWEQLQSSATGWERMSFTKTSTFDEATELFKHGWEEQAKKLTQQIKIKSNDFIKGQKGKNFYDMVGFQPCVPRYVQGIPTSMINRKQVPMKQKVITLTKDIGYNGGTDADDIMNWSINILLVVKKLESEGFKVNLNIILGTEAEQGRTGVERVISKIRIKNANERLNISKLAFPLVHPSMLRRLYLRYIEVVPDVTAKDFTSGYGIPLEGLSQFGEAIDGKSEYLLPKRANDPQEVLDSIKRQLQK